PRALGDRGGDHVARRLSGARAARRCGRGSRARAARDGAQGGAAAHRRSPPGPRHRARDRALPHRRAAHRRVARLGVATRAAVAAWISDYVRRLVIRYDVRNLTHGRRAAHGHTAIATLDREGRLRLETPPEIVARIRG